MAAAMKGRPYLVNEGPLPPGYWHSLLNGGGLPDDWCPPKTRVERKSGRLGDVLGWIGGMPLYSDRAKDLLIALSEGATKFQLFGEIKGSTYWVMGSIPSADVLDEESSDLNKTSDGVIRSIQRFVFREELLSNSAAIFALPGRADCEIFVKREIPEEVVSKKLTGFQFRDPNLPSLRRLYLGEDVNAFPGVRP